MIPQGAATLYSNVPAAPSLSILTTVPGGSEVREEIVLLQRLVPLELEPAAVADRHDFIAHGVMPAPRGSETA